jgi:transcriptional regulator with XRE-family HTH domain
MDFLERLKYTIKSSGLRREDFAKKCGVSRSQLFRYLNGDQEPGTGFYREMKTNIPGVNLDWLISGIEESDRQTTNKETESETKEDITHSELVNYFIDKDIALKINWNLIKLEKVDPTALVEIDEYIKMKMKIKGIEEDVKKKETKETHPTWNGQERRKREAS